MSLSLSPWFCLFHCFLQQRINRNQTSILIFADDLGWKDVGYQGSDFMEKNKDKPFFVYLPHYAIHTGL